MKPLHGLVVAAVVAVGAMLFFLLDSGDSRTSTRSRHDRDADKTTATDPERDGSGPIGSAGDGEASVKNPTCFASLVVSMPDGTAAEDAEVVTHGARSLRARTGGDGALRIGLVAGSYTLLATKGAAAGSMRFVLKEGDDRDLGALALKEAFAIRGVVYDIRKTPIAGAVVEAIPVDTGRLPNWLSYGARLTQPDEVAARATADAHGKYRLLVPGRGHFAFRATASKFAVEVEDALAVREDMAGIDFYLQPGKRLEGKVVDEDRQPVAGAMVVASAGRGFMSVSAKAETVTAGDGTFALDVRPGNSIQLAAQAEGFAPHLNRRQMLTGRPVEIVLVRGLAVRLKAVDKQTGRAAPDVEVMVSYGAGTKAGKTDGSGEITLNRIPEQKGRGSRNQLSVFVGGGEYVAQQVSTANLTPQDGLLDLGEVKVATGGVVSGVVRDKQTGKPIEGAMVRPFGGRSSMQVNMAFMQDVRTDKAGRYKLAGVNLKASMILAACDGYLLDIDRGELFRRMRGGQSLFGEGAQEAIVDVELTPANSVTGVVLGPDGRPVPGARVQRRGGRGGVNGMLGIGTPSTISDAQGRFVVSGFKEGDTVGLQATHRDYAASRQETSRAGSGTEIALHLEAPLLLTGKVVDESGKPIQDVRVSVQVKSKGRARWTRGSARPGITDAEGVFTIRNAPSGELTVAYHHDKYKPQSKEIAIAAGRSEEDLGSLTLGRGPGIEGVVVDSQGKPIADVVVNGMWSGKPVGFTQGNVSQERTWGNATTDEKGRFTMYGLREGSYRLSVNANNLTAERPVVQTGTKDVKIVAKQAVEFSGRVVSAGKPVSRVWIRAQLATAESKAVNWASHLDSSRTGDDGRFTLRRLPPDSSFDLVFTHNAYKTTTVRGVSSADSGRAFELEAGIRIAGVVTEPGGRKVSGASLRLYVDNKSSKWARTDAAGAFQFGGIEGTTFEIEVTGSMDGHIKSARRPVEAGDTAVRIEVERGYEIRGTLTVRGEASLRGYRIEAVEGDTTVQTGWAQPNREFVLRGLKKGSYTLRLLSFSGGKSEVVHEVPNVGAGTKNLKIEITN